MKPVRMFIVGLILGIGLLATFTHSALAQKGVKLVADKDHDIEPQLSAAISRNSVIVGSPSLNAATVFTFNGRKWTKQAQLVPRNEGDAGWSVAISGDSLIIGVPRDNVVADTSGSAFIYVRKGKKMGTAGDATRRRPNESRQFRIFRVDRQEHRYCRCPKRR